MRRLFSLMTVGFALLGAPGLHAADAEDPVVAIVDGQSIKRSEILRVAEGLPEQYRQVPIEMIFEPLVGRVIDGRLLARAAEKRKIADQPEVRDALERARRETLSEELIQMSVREGTTKEKLEQAYSAMRAQPGFAVEEVHALHILVKTKEEAEAVMAELAKGGDFTALAKERSIDPSAKENGGDLGFFQHGMMVGPFADAAFALDKGATAAAPVESQFGWHVIRVVDKRMSVPTFEEKEPELREQVARQIVTALVTQARDGVVVQRFNFDGSPKAN